VQPHLILKLRKAGIHSSEKVHFARSLEQASLRWQNEQRLKTAVGDGSGPIP
jgi:hypothetical protein